MKNTVIYHPPRHIRYTVSRMWEIERDCPHCPDGLPEILANCPDCDCTMAYRGLGRLRNGARVHHFECVHSYREVYSVSVAVTE